MTMTDELVTEARKGGPCAELGDRCRAIEAASGCFCAAVADRIEALTAERDRFQRAFAAQSAKVQNALDVGGETVRAALLQYGDEKARAALTGEEPSHE